MQENLPVNVKDSAMFRQPQTYAMSKYRTTGTAITRHLSVVAILLKLAMM